MLDFKKMREEAKRKVEEKKAVALEKAKERSLNEKFSLENLFIIEVGVKDEYHLFKSSNQYTIATYMLKSINGSVSKFPKYVDIFTKQVYYLCDNIYVEAYQQCCINPISIVSIFSKSSYRDKLLTDGFITKRDAIALYNQLNSKYEKPINSIELSLTNSSQEKIESQLRSEITEGKLLNDNVYNNQPAIGRDQEVREVITVLASEKKSPILVGPSGTGKTTIAEQLVYQIQKGNVPNFLKNKKIIELDTTSMVAGTKYVGTLEEKFKKIIREAKDNDALLFIDEIHTIYGAGSTAKNDNDIAEMLKKAIDRENIRVIGTTTSDEYEKYFSTDALKRRFEPVLVNEPKNEVLATIIDKVFHDYSNNSNISLSKIEENLDKVIQILIDATLKSCRTYKDNVHNPDLVIGIVDKSFADAKINDCEELSYDNIIYGVDTCSRIYDSVKQRTINSIKSIKPKVKKIGTSNIVAFKG